MLVEQVQLLRKHRSEMRLVLQLQRELRLLVQERIASEDEFDAAQLDLRKHKRHSQSFSACCSRSDESKEAIQAMECRCEQRVEKAGRQLQALAERVEQERHRLQIAEAELPLKLLPVGGSDCPAGQGSLWPEGSMACRLAEMEQKYHQVAMRMTMLQVERDELARKVAKGRGRSAAEMLGETDLMCPITHERMREPVLAADAHTYERSAIETWMQSHNTSPMTGAPLVHRFLTQNFAMRRVIESYEACTAQSDCGSSDDSSSESLESGSSQHY